MLFRSHSLPVYEFDIVHRVQDAFRFLANGKNTGKVVLRMSCAHVAPALQLGFGALRSRLDASAGAAAAAGASPGADLPAPVVVTVDVAPTDHLAELHPMLQEAANLFGNADLWTEAFGDRCEKPPPNSRRRRACRSTWRTWSRSG